MARLTHVYDWAVSRGYKISFGDAEAAPTHLLLDGGKWRVPEESHGALLNAYAATLARCPSRRPCVVEVRTPVFRMFADLDTRFETEAAAQAAHGGQGAVTELWRRVCAAVAPGRRALVCAANRVKRERDGTFKMGFHLVWPEVYVRPATALHLRGLAVERLEADPALREAMGLARPWDAVVDAAVYRSSGLRLPWSAKGRDDDGFYELAFEVTPDGDVRPARAGTVSEVREALRHLSIRAYGVAPTLTGPDDEDDQPPGAESCAGATHKSLAAYADVLPRLAGCLPVQFLGQRFTAVLAAEHCFMLRSTARYCFNLGRPHRTNNVYFLLTRRGVCQRCYCRCETAEGRRYGMCKDFSSQVWPVPPDVLAAFFSDDDDEEAPAKRQKACASSTAPGTMPGTMPSRTGRSFLNLDSLVARSRPALSPGGPHRRRGRA